MPIRTKPFDEIDEADIRSLVDRSVREDLTIEFKKTFPFVDAPSDSEHRHEFLKDVTAMANAYGGTIVYGIREGKGANEGVAEAITPFKLTRSEDATGNTIDAILETGVDERIIVRSKGVPIGKGDTYCWVVRIPASHLAPHMVARECKKPKPKFYRRINRTNAQLDARGIKEIALKASTAEEKARALIDERVQFMLRKGRLLFDVSACRFGDVENPVGYRVQALLHIVPLFPRPFDAAHIEKTLSAADLTLGATRYALEGLHYEMPGGNGTPHEHILFLRRGGLEFQDFDLVYREEKFQLLATDYILKTFSTRLSTAFKLSKLELLERPAMVRFSLVDVTETYLPPDKFRRFTMLEHEILSTEPWVLGDWDERSREQIRIMMDTVWQAYGAAKAPIERWSWE